MISIINSKAPERASKTLPHCIRHITYLNGDFKQRKTMKFSSVGPITDEDGVLILQYLGDITKTYYPNKPTYLKNYECDILYYEAVVWALMKVKNISRKKASMDYSKNIFNSTKEEKIKRRCNLILSDITEASANLSAESASESKHFQDDESLVDLNELPSNTENEENNFNIFQEEITSLVNDIIDKIEVSNM